MPFGILDLGGVHTGATWQIPLNHPCAAAMWPVVELLVIYYYQAIYRRANFDVSLLRNESRLDWLPKAACGLSIVPSVAPPPPVPAGRRPGICP